MAAIRRRVWQLSSIAGFGASRSEVSSSLSSSQRAIFDPFSVSGTRHFSQVVKSNRKHLFLVDTLALVRRLEGEGVPSKQAEAITAAITEVLNDSLENVSQSLVSKAQMQKIEMMQESNLSKFKAEVQSSQVFLNHVDVMLCVEFEVYDFGACGCRRA
ncbi:hypothetical protein GmHk_16G046839 [Glycine max]|nr:hypothetical protein GmHk_16G046839 [Glycine max]